MALIPYTTQRTILKTTTTIAATGTFCDLMAAMLSASSNFATLLQDVQTQINNKQDTYQTKVNALDCPGFLADKFVSSSTIEVKPIPAVDGCEKLSFEIKTPTTGNPNAGILSDVCETAWTAITSYATFTGQSGLDQVWQGSVEWSINKLGEIKLRGKANVSNFLVLMTGNKTMQSPQAIQNKIFELPNIPCIEDKIGNSSDYYGLNNATYPMIGSQDQSVLLCHLKRIGRSFYIDLSSVRNNDTYCNGTVDIEISFGHLKSIN